MEHVSGISTSIFVACLAALVCGCDQNRDGRRAIQPDRDAATEPGQKQGARIMSLTEQDITDAIDNLQRKFGPQEAARIDRGVHQAARLWNAEDGSGEEFVAFCAAHFLVGEDLDALFERFEHKFEMLRGHMYALRLQLRLEMDEDTGPLLPMDPLFAKYDPMNHMLDDLFATKLAFMALLNFPVLSLEEMQEQADTLTRRQWAEARLAQTFAYRVPAHVNQAVTEAYADADRYVSSYNIVMDRVIGPDGKPMFREGLKLISHWGLRDELRALYADPRGQPRQEMIHTIMERIILQEIPEVVINRGDIFWDPIANTVDGRPANREPDTRYAQLLGIFRAHLLEDPYYPDLPTHIDRRSIRRREIREPEFERLLTLILEAPVGKEVGRLIEKRLGRELLPFDIWYDGLKARGAIDQQELDRVVQERYPDAEAFQHGIADLLVSLGFEKTTAEFLQNRIEVDPARGAGHAWGPGMRTEKAHLRTRVSKGGMDYQGYNTAVHELGHNVEELFSLYKIDHTLLGGVPNTAFSEAFAFVFQARDLDLLGLTKPDPQSRAMRTLDDFWATREIGAVGLVDMRVWRWLYAHPDATPAELREAVVRIATDVWNAYFAEIFGLKDTPILGIYSHMIDSGLYLPDYPLGFIIAFQLGSHFETRPLGQDMERICSQGRILPDAWMKGAVGRPLSAEVMIQASQTAVEALAAS